MVPTLRFAYEFQAGLVESGTPASTALDLYVKALLDKAAQEISLLLPNPVSFVWKPGCEVVVRNSLGVEHVFAVIEIAISPTGFPIWIRWPFRQEVYRQEAMTIEEVESQLEAVLNSPVVANLIAFTSGMKFPAIAEIAPAMLALTRDKLSVSAASEARRLPTRT